MAYIDGEDTQGGLFTAIDGDLTPFLQALDRDRDAPRTPLDIIPAEARNLVVSAETAYRKAVLDCLADRREPNAEVLMQEVARQVPEIQFQGSTHVGFYVVPGVEKIDTKDVKRNLVIAGIDFENAEADDLSKLGHYHIGATVGSNRGKKRGCLPGEYADTWDVAADDRPDVGLYWADAYGRHRIHQPQDGIRVARHGSYDDFSAAKRALVRTPKLYMGAYWGGIDMKAKSCPKIRRLGR